jgi:hypothetical protein
MRARSSVGRVGPDCLRSARHGPTAPPPAPQHPSMRDRATRTHTSCRYSTFRPPDRRSRTASTQGTPCRGPRSSRRRQHPPPGHRSAPARYDTSARSRPARGIARPHPGGRALAGSPCPPRPGAVRPRVATSPARRGIPTPQNILICAERSGPPGGTYVRQNGGYLRAGGCLLTTERDGALSETLRALSCGRAHPGDPHGDGRSSAGFPIADSRRRW